MSNFSPRLTLKRNDGSDPFLRADFTDNWNKLDLAPGVHICTSASRPTWGTAQAGRMIMETDTKRTIFWDGTAWKEQLQVGPAWSGALTKNVHVAKGTTTTYTLGTIVTTRPGNLMVITTCQIASKPLNAQLAYLYGLIDGVDRTLGSGVATKVQWSDNNTVGGAYDHRPVTVHSTYGILAGSHTIGFKVTVGTLSNQDAYVGGFAWTAYLANTTAT